MRYVNLSVPSKWTSTQEKQVSRSVFLAEVLREVCVQRGRHNSVLELPGFRGAWSSAANMPRERDNLMAAPMLEILNNQPGLTRISEADRVQLQRPKSSPPSVLRRPFSPFPNLPRYTAVAIEFIAMSKLKIGGESLQIATPKWLLTRWSIDLPRSLTAQSFLWSPGAAVVIP